MMGRCYKPQKHNHKKYAENGITVCERWHDVRNFIADVPERPSKLHTLDRIENKKGYEPGNVRWATKREQQNNRNCNVRIVFAGFNLTIREWERKLGKCKSAFHCKVYRNKMTIEEAVIYFARKAGLSDSETKPEPVTV